jgi:DNA polymerase III gamma/tau subunit
MRAFDLLSTAEQEIRNTSHPRYYFEMILLRWMHLRKLVPLSDLLEQLGGGSRPSSPRAASAPASGKPAPTRSKLAPTSDSNVAPTSGKLAPTSDSKVAPTSGKLAPTSDSKIAPTSDLKDRLLAEVRTAKNALYSLAIAQAQRIDVDGEAVSFTFPSNQNVARTQLEQNRQWLEATAERLAGRRMKIVVIQQSASSDSSAEVAAPAEAPAKRDLKAEALSSTGVQALLDVFPAEIRDVEEM